MTQILAPDPDATMSKSMMKRMAHAPATPMDRVAVKLLVENIVEAILNAADEWEKDVIEDRAPTGLRRHLENTLKEINGLYT